MKIAFKSGDPAKHTCDLLLVPVFGAALKGRALDLDAALGGLAGRCLTQGDLGTSAGATLLLPIAGGLKASRVLLFQCGEDGAMEGLREGLAAAFSAACKGPAKSLACLLSDGTAAGFDAAALTEETVLAAHYARYRFHRYLKTAKPVAAASLVLLLSGRVGAAQQKALTGAEALAKGIALTRTLGDEPGNVCHPTYLAKEAQRIARAHGTVKVEVLSEAEMKRLGMGAFLAVSGGSAQPGKLIVLRYSGGARNAAPHVLVGKGITFDTGGISLKPGPGMDEMKYDMCGAASVLGTVSAVAEAKLPLNVIGVIAAAENMPSGVATRPGDIVKTLSGQTVEILNTDAEGRLVLCDALTYAERFKPASVVDIATLTGAAVTALGSIATALYANNDGLASALLEAGEGTGDRAWRMPLWEAYQKQLKSNFADMANIGGREAGSVTAACFLARFTKAYPWAHLDIAGSAWRTGADKGATGRPVRLLMRYLEDQCA
ncbi:MAG: leucyl aminopeptidase [Pseudomonadales bacterium]|nr:leucyl aminopeptidase [Pseudomonadales bacterium]